LIPILIVAVCTFVVNIFFGYWRANTRKFTLAWILAIHIPVPIAIGLRLALIGWNWYLIPAFVIDYAAGQYLGGKVRIWMSRQECVQLTSFLGADLGKLLSAKLRKNTAAS
jgi:hypothetical protein